MDEDGRAHPVSQTCEQEKNKQLTVLMDIEDGKSMKIPQLGMSACHLHLEVLLELAALEKRACFPRQKQCHGNN